MNISNIRHLHFFVCLLVTLALFSVCDAVSASTRVRRRVPASSDALSTTSSIQHHQNKHLEAIPSFSEIQSVTSLGVDLSTTNIAPSNPFRRSKRRNGRGRSRRRLRRNRNRSRRSASSASSASAAAAASARANESIPIPSMSSGSSQVVTKSAPWKEPDLPIPNVHCADTDQGCEVNIVLTTRINVPEPIKPEDRPKAPIFVPRELIHAAYGLNRRFRRTHKPFELVGSSKWGPRPWWAIPGITAKQKLKKLAGPGLSKSQAKQYSTQMMMKARSMIAKAALSGAQAELKLTNDQLKTLDNKAQNKNGPKKKKFVFGVRSVAPFPKSVLKKLKNRLNQLKNKPKSVLKKLKNKLNNLKNKLKKKLKR